MGKHNKSARKEYLKRRRKRLKRKRAEEVSEEVNKDDEISTSTDHMTALLDRIAVNVKLVVIFFKVAILILIQCHCL